MHKHLQFAGAFFLNYFFKTLSIDAGENNVYKEITVAECGTKSTRVQRNRGYTKLYCPVPKIVLVINDTINQTGS